MRRTIAAVAAVIIAGLALAACGSSQPAHNAATPGTSTPASSSTPAAATSSTPAPASTLNMTGIGAATPDPAISGAYRIQATGDFAQICSRQPQLQYRLQQAGWTGQQAALVDLHGPGPVAGPDPKILSYDPASGDWSINGDLAQPGSFLGNQFLAHQGGNEALCVVGPVTS